MKGDSLRSASDEERTIIVRAWALYQKTKSAMPAGSDVERRFVVGRRVWGTEDDHFTALFGVPVILDYTLDPDAILIAVEP